MITDDDITTRLRAVQAPQTMQLPPVERLVSVAGRHRRRRRAAATSLALTAVAGAALSITLTVAHTTHDGRASLIPATPPASSTTAPAPSAEASPKQPGEDVVTPLSEPVTKAGTGGTTTIELGPRPPLANKVEIRLTCLSSGTFNFSGGGIALCSMSDTPEDPPTPQALQLPLSPGQTSLTITASHDARWRLTTSYVRAIPSAWSVNASGQTFGVLNENGIPDLVAVQAANGREGYVYAQQRFPALASSPPKGTTGQSRPDQTRSVPVYLSDGKTRIGDFVN
jgi:hypothetical protein